MGFVMLRAVSWLNRFGDLPRVRRVFDGMTGPRLVRRKLFGYVMEMDVARSTAQQLLLVEGERFVDERFVIKRLLRPGMVAVDVGANIGYYLLLIERHVGPDGRVICIEPSIENLPELRANIAANAFGNVVLHTVALGSEDGETGLETGINSGVSDGRDAPYRVPLRRLDNLVTERVDFLKIDVEGYEGQVLEGAEALLAASRPNVFLEMHPHIVGRFGYSSRRIFAMLARHYRDIVLYEKKLPADESITEKVAVRYLGRDPMRRVDAIEPYLERCDAGEVQHTFWLICRP